MAVLTVSDPGSNWRASPDEPMEKAWERARLMIREAKAAGFHVQKWQALSADLMYERDTPAWHLVKPYELPIDWYPRLKEECDNEGIEFAISVYHESQVALVDPLVKRHKVSSFECENERLLEAVRDTGKDVLVSVGTLADDDEGTRNQKVALLTSRIKPWGNLDTRTKVTALHCVSSYPAALRDQNLSALYSWQAHNLMHLARPLEYAYHPPLSWRYGFSDHTPQDSAVAAVVAVALGASVIEVHTRTDEQTVSPDCLPHARDPFHMAAYVESIRQAEEALGDGTPVLGTSAKYKWNPATGKRGQ
jgi:sialic acid synthase SpsE